MGTPELLREVTGINVLFWFICFTLICSLMFTCVYSLFTLTDLEADALNPVDACRKLNRAAKYEFYMLVGACPAQPSELSPLRPRTYA